ncbi:hypothetical protein [Bradyrhizobium sp. LMTR 3]|uniref:hypothetical protein n=1 Tax=Bradyrhizobium sp. LMTR 3 TaxID=189873 RepID=UPI00114659B3|nr:hypothetical protein [Bradyrhizobium sp. LMTR 3]
MLSIRTLFVGALLVPFLATSLPAQTAKKMDAKSARAECFRQANAAADKATFGGASADPAAATERNAAGAAAYTQCARKMGIRP